MCDTNKQISESPAQGDPAVFTIGLVINVVMKPCCDIMIETIRYVMKRKDLRIRIFHGSPATTVANIKSFVASGVDGVVIFGFCREIVMGFLQSMRKRPPVVLGSYCAIPKEDAACIKRGGVIEIDNALIGGMAADYLNGHGLRNYAFLGSNIFRECVSSGMRSRAFEARLRDVCHDDITFTSLTVNLVKDHEDCWHDGHKAVVNWLKDLPLPCGLFVNGEIEAFYVQQTCRELGISIPEQIEVLCVENGFGLCEQAQPAITGIGIDYGAFAQSAVEMLLAWRSDEHQASSVACVCEGNLHERGSTAGGRGYGRVAERAREFIRSHAFDGVSVDEVAHALGVSRRTLEMRVRESLGKSVLEMLHDVRLREAYRLLISTEMPVLDIAMRTGFHSVGTLTMLFKKRFGIPMRLYRQLYKSGSAEELKF